MSLPEIHDRRTFHAPTEAAAPVVPCLLTINREKLQYCLLLTVTGDLDLLTAPKFRASVRRALREERCAVVVDLTELSFLGAPGVSALVELLESASGGRTALLLVVGTNRRVCRPLAVCGLTDRLPLYASLTGALMAR